MIKEKLIDYIQTSIKENWSLASISNYGKNETLKYGDVGLKILNMHANFKKLGIHKGDKIALCGANSINWAISYLSVISYGSVIVPILVDFSSDDITSIINESGSKYMFIQPNIYSNLDKNKLSSLKNIFSLDDFSTLFGDGDILTQIVENVSVKDFSLGDIDNDSLATIIYTSGTTGFSKGVMLSHNSLSCNVRYAIANMPVKPNDTILSFLPLAHVFGCLFDFLFPFSKGACISFLSTLPSPNVLLKAFAEIKPNLILMVPLIIEKIYIKQILPVINKPLIKIMLKVPLISSILKGSIRKKVTNSFGGEFYEVIIGGSALNEEAEKFFMDIGFKFTVGYGMTECGPLISYAPCNQHYFKSCGKVIDTLEIKIDSNDDTPGEIMVKGENVMLGYYKNPKATAEVLQKDGWLRTGDLGVIDENKNIFIRGRSKNMLLSGSGQNIYPEEIESKLNNMPYVIESLVIQKDGKLEALVYPDLEKVKNDNLSKENLNNIMENTRKELNLKLPDFARISVITLMDKEFEKNPTKKIKRFLYI